MKRIAVEHAVAAGARGASIALGNFDGVHRGHIAVIEAAAEAASNIRAPIGAAVFIPHPRRYLHPNTAPFLLQTPSQRANALGERGVSYVYEIPFDRSLVGLSGRDFVERLLVRALGVVHVSVGANFRFGAGRAGDVLTLAALGKEYGFTVSPVPSLRDPSSYVISSTLIRMHIERGEMEQATELLTRPWAIEGVVARGFQRGRAIGFPTINIPLGEYLRPRLGVYAVRVNTGDGIWRNGVASVGVNPTVGALPEPLLEAHIFDFDADLYGAHVEVRMIGFLREEAKFDTMEAMTAQIERDAENARKLLD